MLKELSESASAPDKPSYIEAIKDYIKNPKHATGIKPGQQAAEDAYKFYKEVNDLGYAQFGLSFIIGRMMDKLASMVMAVTVTHRAGDVDSAVGRSQGQQVDRQGTII